MGENLLITSLKQVGVDSSNIFLRKGRLWVLYMHVQLYVKVIG